MPSSGFHSHCALDWVYSTWWRRACGCTLHLVWSFGPVCPKFSHWLSRDWDTCGRQPPPSAPRDGWWKMYHERYIIVCLTSKLHAFAYNLPKREYVHPLSHSCRCSCYNSASTTRLRPSQLLVQRSRSITHAHASLQLHVVTVAMTTAKLKAAALASNLAPYSEEETQSYSKAVISPKRLAS